MNDNLTLKFDLININDEPEFYYWGNTSRLSQYDEYGTSATIEALHTPINLFHKFKKASIVLAFFLTTSSLADYVEVENIYETPPVVTKGDAADDPAIWVNKSNPSNSIVFGTDKKSGIYSYNLQGQELGFIQILVILITLIPELSMLEMMKMFLMLPSFLRPIEH